MIEVGGGQDYARLPHPGCFLDIGPTGGTTATVAPSLASGIEPAPVWQNADNLAMWSPAALADAAGTLEAHKPAELRPVDWVEPAHLSPDRHWRLCSRACQARGRRSLARYRDGEQLPP